MREEEEDEEEVEAEEEQPSGRMSLCRLRDKKAGDDLNMEERGAERQRDTGREGGRRRRRGGRRLWLFVVSPSAPWLILKDDGGELGNPPRVTASSASEQELAFSA